MDSRFRNANERYLPRRKKWRRTSWARRRKDDALPNSKNKCITTIIKSFHPDRSTNKRSFKWNSALPFQLRVKPYWTFMKFPNKLKYVSTLSTFCEYEELVNELLRRLLDEDWTITETSHWLFSSCRFPRFKSRKPNYTDGSINLVPLCLSVLTY